MRSSLLLAFLVAICLADFPPRPQGVELTHVPGASSFVAYMDIQCPDSAAAWPVFLELLKLFGSRISFRHYLTPLPFHQQSYRANVAMMAAFHLAQNDTQKYISILTNGFKSQSLLYNDASENMTKFQVLESLYSNVVVPLNLGASLEDFLSAHEAESRPFRIEWKLGAMLGVYGTPSYSANSALLEPQSTFNSYSLSQWKIIFDQI